MISYVGIWMILVTAVVLFNMGTTIAIVQHLEQLEKRIEKKVEKLETTQDSCYNPFAGNQKRGSCG